MRILLEHKDPVALSARHAEMKVNHCLYQDLFESEGVSLAECCCCSQDSVWCGPLLFYVSKCALATHCTSLCVHVMQVVKMGFQCYGMNLTGMQVESLSALLLCDPCWPSHSGELCPPGSRAWSPTEWALSAQRGWLRATTVVSWSCAGFPRADCICVPCNAGG